MNFLSDGDNKINLKVDMSAQEGAGTHRTGIALHNGELDFDGGRFEVYVDGAPGSHSIDGRNGITIAAGSKMNVKADSIHIETNQMAIGVTGSTGSSRPAAPYGVLNEVNFEADSIYLKGSQGIISMLNDNLGSHTRFTFSGRTVIEAIANTGPWAFPGDYVGGHIIAGNATDFEFNGDVTLTGEDLTSPGTSPGHELKGVTLVNRSKLVANDDFSLQSNGGHQNTGLRILESQAQFKGQTHISLSNGIESATGIHIDGQPGMTTHAEFQDDLTISTAGSHAAKITGIEVLSAGTADIQKGLFINDNPSIDWSLFSTGADSRIDANSSGTGTVQVEGNIGAADSGTLEMTLNNANSWLKAASYTARDTARVGILNMNISNGAVWEVTGNSYVTNLLLQGGRVSMLAPGSSGAFKTLTVEGNYSGGGTLTMNTALGSDNSATDKLIVEGNTSGHTLVAINNIGGMGAQTVEGIEIVNVAGTSDGTFEKESRIVAGAYDYDVVRRGSNWYLSSTVDPVDPVDPNDPTDPGAPASPETPQLPVHPGGPSQIRPEFGSYLANNLAANTLFISRLHDRPGETQYTDVLTGEKKTTSMWIRNVGIHTRFHDSSEQLKTQSNNYVLQMGGDLAQWSSDGLDRWHLGLMAGYANSRSRTTSTLNNHNSRGKVDGYSVGLYGTWYENELDKSGGYVDTWMLYNWFDNTVDGQYQASEAYKSKGITAAVEAGYSLKVGESQQLTYWIQPKVQVVWMDVQADDHRERYGTQVKVDSTGNLMTSLGARAYFNRKPTGEEDRMAGIQPFVEANWIHNSHSPRVTMGEVQNDVQGVKDLAELKVGVEGQLTSRLTVWGNVSGQMGSDSYRNAQGMVGVKYHW
ncbi:autotransporter outer membrane beta-barrel domain-containing protein [Citrobacter sp. Ct235]|uniref:autotransporter outer membrane beta-barrel domain-containing protein n=1 Tax=Citrobacter sp. Ct235 TaxID=2985157 RepID=UPI0025763E4F|nr:autotransporter outer membrane beta-barrel domain-containing protein [Citrobacter sp. Ct235]MDM2738174.1 autotransporter outer membrane beta-barrel domain-containing protein [Citrobacter sp. Ct235]